VRLADSRWLTDENIHPEVVAHLRSRALDVLDVREAGWYGWNDEELLEEAHRQGRVILTHDGTSARWRCSGVVPLWASSGFDLVTYGPR
jgi:predicted nuclease of predicted toxin-antitoxin system